MPLTKDTAHRKDLNSGICEMQHRHFATVATIIREMKIPETEFCIRQMIATEFADRLRASNPNFDRRRFLLACGIVEGN